MEAKNKMNIKEESIKRYEEKIAWAMTQNMKDRPDMEKMYSAIGHEWSSSNCPYCMEYGNNCPDMCELRMDVDYCCDGLWLIMNGSKTWREWIENAERVLQYIKDNG
jgi:hypothetical protein